MQDDGIERRQRQRGRAAGRAGGAVRVQPQQRQVAARLQVQLGGVGWGAGDLGQAGLAVHGERAPGAQGQLRLQPADVGHGYAVRQLPAVAVAAQAEADLAELRAAAVIEHGQPVQARVRHVQAERRGQRGRQHGRRGRAIAVDGQAGRMQFADGHAFREQLQRRPADVDAVHRDDGAGAAVHQPRDAHAVVQRAAHALHFDLAAAGGGDALQQLAQGGFPPQQPDGAAQHHAHRAQADQGAAQPAARAPGRLRRGGRRGAGRGAGGQVVGIGHQNVNPSEKCRRYLRAAWPYAMSTLMGPTGLFQRAPTP